MPHGTLTSKAGALKGVPCSCGGHSPVQWAETRGIISDQFPCNTKLATLMARSQAYSAADNRRPSYVRKKRVPVYHHRNRRAFKGGKNAASIDVASMGDQAKRLEHNLTACCLLIWVCEEAQRDDVKTEMFNRDEELKIRR